jgi:hypothetical protein
MAFAITDISPGSKLTPSLTPSLQPLWRKWLWKQHTRCKLGGHPRLADYAIVDGLEGSCCVAETNNTDATIYSTGN